MLFDKLSSDYHPPLYFVILKIWIEIFGASIISLKIFQGVNLVMLLYSSIIIIRYRVDDRKYIYSIVFALSMPILLYGVMLRYYAMAASIAVFSTYYLLRFLNSENKKYVVYVAVMYALLLYTDYPSAMIMIAHVIIVLIRARRHIIIYSYTIVGAITLFAPWGNILFGQLKQITEAGSTAHFNESAYSILIKYAYSFYSYLIGETILPTEAIDLTIAATAITALVAVYMYNRSWKRAIREWPLLLVAITGLMMTSIITTYISTHTSFVYTPSRSLYVYPHLFVVLISPITGSSRKYLPGVVLWIIMLTYGWYNYINDRHFFMPVYATPWGDISKQIVDSGCPVVSDESHVLRYYEKHNGLSIDILETADAIIRNEPHGVAQKKPCVNIILTDRMSTESELNQRELDRLLGAYKNVDTTTFLTYPENYLKLIQRYTKKEHYKGKVIVIEAGP